MKKDKKRSAAERELRIIRKACHFVVARIARGGIPPHIPLTLNPLFPQSTNQLFNQSTKVSTALKILWSIKNYLCFINKF